MQLHLQKHQRLNSDETLPAQNAASPPDEEVIQIRSTTSITLFTSGYKLDVWTWMRILMEHDKKK